jgi:hypothetical protein
LYGSEALADCFDDVDEVVPLEPFLRDDYLPAGLDVVELVVVGLGELQEVQGDQHRGPGTHRQFEGDLLAAPAQLHRPDVEDRAALRQVLLQLAELPVEEAQLLQQPVGRQSVQPAAEVELQQLDARVHVDQRLAGEAVAVGVIGHPYLGRTGAVVAAQLAEEVVVEGELAVDHEGVEFGDVQLLHLDAEVVEQVLERLEARLAVGEGGQLDLRFLRQRGQLGLQLLHLLLQSPDLHLALPQSLLAQLLQLREVLLFCEFGLAGICL